jgi:3-oxoadipate enol-lactonase
MILELGPVRLAVRSDGPETAPALLLVNSLGTTTEMWEPQVATLAQHFRVVRYDARGHGGSEAPTGPVTLDDLGRDAVGVLDGLGLDRAAVCGVSLGGMTALWLAIHAPDRIGRIVVANSAPHVPPPDLWNARIAKVLAEGLDAVADAVIERWLTGRFRAEHPDVAARLREIFLANDAKGYAACCAAVRDLDLRAGLPSVRAPTLIIAGTEDRATPPELSDLMANAVPKAGLVTFRAAHLSNWECPEEFSLAVLSFLSE